jgi:NADPH:quinone reductase-like Zn-dependent oxidoreductase
MKTIRYHRYGGPEVMVLEDVPTRAPGAGEVLIDVHATSVVPGDWKMRAGLLQDIFPARFPITPGRDGSGVIAACGPGVTDFHVGEAVVFTTDRVSSGSYVESIVRKAEAIVRKPANVTHAEAAAGNHAGMCAWLALVDAARVGRDTKVLVLGGAGAIGGIGVQLARYLGAQVAATCRASNVDYVRGLGAHTVIARDREDFSDRLTGYDVVFDLVGGAPHERAYRVLRRGGRIAYLIGLPFTDRSKEFGVVDQRVPIEERVDALAAMMDLIAAGAIKPQVERVFPFVQAGAAHRFLEAGEHVRGRVVLEVCAS